MTETAVKSSPYLGEDLISDESYLRQLPVALSLGERMRFDAVVIAADIIVQSFSLMQQLTAQAKTDVENFNNGRRAFLLSLCWTIVDQLHAIRQLLKSEEPGPLTLSFMEAAATATSLRNAMDHLAQNLNNLSASKGPKFPLFGSLSYFYTPQDASAFDRGDMITVTSGAYLGDFYFAMSNPAVNSFTIPTGLFRLTAFGHVLEFGHVIGTLRDLLRKIESSIEAIIRKKVEERAKTPSDIDQAMATLGGNFVIFTSVSFFSEETCGASA